MQLDKRTFHPSPGTKSLILTLTVVLDHWPLPTPTSINMQNESFPALTGFYRLLFFYIEPISTTVPVFMIWFFPGATWFYNELVPEMKSVSNLHLPAKMAIWQLANCYFLLGLIGSLVFRAARDSLGNDLVAQERIVGALLMALAIADISHVAVSVLATPYEIIMKPSSWNGAFIGNVPFTLFLFCCRMLWFIGFGRQTYYYSVKKHLKSQ